MYNDIALVCGTYLSTKLIAALVKLGYGININIIVFSRLFIAGTFSLLYLMQNWRELQNVKLYLYCRPALTRFAAILCTYYGYQRLSLQTATAIGLSQPFFTILFSFLLLDDRISSTKIYWMILGCCGAWIACVGAVYDIQDKGYIVAMLVMFVANILSAMNGCLMKPLVDVDGPAISAASLSACVGLFGCTVLYNEIGPQCELISIFSFCYIVLIGTVGLIDTALYHFTMERVTPNFIAMFYYINIPFAVLIDYFVFNIPIDLYAAFGSMIIIYSAIKLQST